MMSVSPGMNAGLAGGYLEGGLLPEGLSWDWRLMLGAGATMIAALMIGGGLIHYLFFSERIAEMKRLAKWGQKLEARYGESSPKEREKLDQWLKGGKL
ncbi:MAG: hypothetical protein A2075_18075 [Geobacteraceae bacterium GWC2_58_44]|nr:MAG: hypothetical protein A2075_18075 [Geobacteraceae bacterium GWC2_58_44]